MLYRGTDGWEHDCWGMSRFWGVPSHPTWNYIKHLFRQYEPPEESDSSGTDLKLKSTPVKGLTFPAHAIRPWIPAITTEVNRVIDQHPELIPFNEKENK